MAVCFSRFWLQFHLASLWTCPPSSSAVPVLAGLVSGFAEAVLCVVPMTTIQVKFCHDSCREVPHYRGLVHGISTIVREEGLHGLYRVRRACRILSHSRKPVAVCANAQSLVRHRAAGCASRAVNVIRPRRL